MSYRWSNTTAGFNMPVKINNGEWLAPTTDWKSITVGAEIVNTGLVVDPNFYVIVQKSIE
jgi:hypothetical protein